MSRSSARVLGEQNELFLALDRRFWKNDQQARNCSQKITFFLFQTLALPTEDGSLQRRNMFGIKNLVIFLRIVYGNTFLSIMSFFFASIYAIDINDTSL